MPIALNLRSINYKYFQAMLTTFHQSRARASRDGVNENLNVELIDGQTYLNINQIIHQSPPSPGIDSIPPVSIPYYGRFRLGVKEAVLYSHREVSWKSSLLERMRET